MNARLSLAAIAAHLAGLLDPGTKVGTGYDRDYLTAFGKVYPAVWVGAQRFIPTDDGRGFSELYRQHGKVEVAVRLVAQRYADGSIDAESRLNALHDGVAGALLGWQPTGADEPFIFVSAQDGETSEAVMIADMIFSCTATYQEAT